MKDLFIGILALIVVGALAYGGWWLKRTINYSFDYEDKVIETVQKQIEPLKLRVLTLEDEVKELKEQKITGWGN